VSDAPLELQLATAQAELRNVYRERAHLVAHLAALYPSVVAYSDPSTPNWPVVTVQTVAGQMCWHIAPDDTELFDLLGDDDDAPVWDGHSTDEKYQRLRFLTEMVALAPQTPEQAPQAPAPAPEPAPTPQEPEQAPQAPAEAPKRRGRPRKTAQAAPEASQTVLEA
jgi:hypothetical protein